MAQPPVHPKVHNKRRSKTNNRRLVLLSHRLIHSDPLHLDATRMTNALKKKTPQSHRRQAKTTLRSEPIRGSLLHFCYQDRELEKNRAIRLWKFLFKPATFSWNSSYRMTIAPSTRRRYTRNRARRFNAGRG